MIEEFLFKVSQIANLGYFIKAVFISNNSFQEGALRIARNSGLMLIEVNSNNELFIKLHKANRDINDLPGSEQTKEIETFLFDVFDLTKVQGLKKYSRKEIEAKANELINKIDENVLKHALKTPLDKIIDFLKIEYEVTFDFDTSINEGTDKEILGYYDVSKNLIRIDRKIIGTERFSFMIAHEVGHLVLHRNLKINQQLYDNFRDSEYDFLSNKYILNNYKNWIEWQANEFASNLIMPNICFYNRLLHVQNYLGISRRGHIYLDDQPVNRKDFGHITTYLSNFFGTTYTSIIFKLEGLELITYDRKIDSYKDTLRGLVSDLDDDF